MNEATDARAKRLDVQSGHLFAIAEICGGAGLFFVLVGFSPPGFVFLLDHANLLFHEAGQSEADVASDLRRSPSR